MIMSDSEISASYREAKDRKSQIQVLADLNACPRGEMEQYLCKLGLIHDTPQPAFDYLRAAELYADGLCDLDIAEQMGVSVYKITAWRRSKGFRPNRKPTQEGKPQAKKRKKPAHKAAPPAPMPPAAPAETGLSVRGLWEILGRIAETYPNAALYLGGGTAMFRRRTGVFRARGRDGRFGDAGRETKEKSMILLEGGKAS